MEGCLMHLDLKKKVGPLPVWAWGSISLVVLFILYRRYQANAASSASSSTEDDSEAGIDPVTGASYADEESAYDSAVTGDLAGTSGTDQSSDNGDDTTTDPFADFDTELQEFINAEQLFQSMGSGNPSSSGGGSTTTPSTSTDVEPVGNASGGAAATPEPVVTANPPNNTPPTVTGALLSVGKLLTPGAILAPAGSRTTKTGYVTVGTGGNNYQYVPTNLVGSGQTIYHSVSSTNPAPGIAKGIGNGLWAVPANFYNAAVNASSSKAHE
jgi:hypothetical protein